jgi:acyl dehydratase
VDKVEVKKGMVFVHQRREIFNASSAGEVEEGDGWGVQEIRTHVFRPPPDLSSSAPTTAGSSTSPPQTSAPILSPPGSTISAERPSPLPSPVSPGPPSPSSVSPSCSFTYTPSSALLFRYSALTFNSHRIHYDHPHTLSIESQPGLLVHGPLTATLLVEVAAKYASERGKRLVEFRYRAVSPVVVDKEVVVRGWAEDQGQDDKEVEIEMTAEQGGKVGMKATAIID